MSKGFVFGLERVRELRVHDEDRAKEELAASLSARLRGEALLRAAEDRLAAAHAAGRDAVVASGAALAARQAWTERMERSRAEAAGDLSRADDEVAARRVAVADAGRARQALDRLRDRQLDAFRLESNRRENAELDEIALRTHLRGRAA